MQAAQLHTAAGSALSRTVAAGLGVGGLIWTAPSSPRQALGPYRSSNAAGLWNMFTVEAVQFHLKDWDFSVDLGRTAHLSLFGAILFTRDFAQLFATNVHKDHEVDEFMF